VQATAFYLVFLPYVSENVCYVFFYNLKHLEIFVIFGTKYPDIPSFKQMHNSHFTLVVLLHYLRMYQQLNSLVVFVQMVGCL